MGVPCAFCFGKFGKCFFIGSAGGVRRFGNRAVGDEVFLCGTDGFRAVRCGIAYEEEQGNGFALGKFFLKIFADILAEIFIKILAEIFAEFRACLLF